MHVLEQYTHGKHGDPALNEDGLFVGDTYAAVVDGVTSKSTANIWHPTPGVVAHTIALQAIERADADARNATVIMRDMQQRIDSALRAQYNMLASAAQSAMSTAALTTAQSATSDQQQFDEAYFRAHPNDRLQLNAVIYSAQTHEIWLFGDCQAMVNGQAIPTLKRVDALLGELRSFAWQALELGDDHHRDQAASDPARELILPFLRLQSNFANQRGDYGYFVFDGFTDLDYPIRTIRVSPNDDIVLASDGYPQLHPTLADSETALADLRKHDPHLVHEFKTTKGFQPNLDSFDDRTFLHLIA